MKSLKSVSLMIVSALLMNVSFAQKNEKTVEVGGAEGILQRISLRTP